MLRIEMKLSPERKRLLQAALTDEWKPATALARETGIAVQRVSHDLALDSKDGKIEASEQPVGHRNAMVSVYRIRKAIDSVADVR